MAKIGFLGAGNMGIGMAACLLDAGHTVGIYNRTASKISPLLSKGAMEKNTAREVATDADVVIAMVGDDAASQAVWLGDNGALAGAKANKPLIIECSTLSHDWVMELSQIVNELGLSYLDCPVTGLPDAAARGELTLFLGGLDSVIKQAQEFLLPLSGKQIHFGGIGSGTAYKLIVNLMGSIQIAATAEALLVAKAAGLDLTMVADALASGGAGSPNVARNSQLMVAGEHETEVVFNARWRLKDTRCGVDFAKSLGQKHGLGLLTQEMFQKVIDRGFSNASESKIIDILSE